MIRSFSRRFLQILRELCGTKAFYRCARGETRLGTPRHLDDRSAADSGERTDMRRTLVWLAILILAFATAVTAQEKQIAKAGVPQLETQVRQLWKAFKNKDKATLSSMIDDQFRMFEEGLATFADKKAEVNAPDEYELLNYTLSDFTVRPLGPNTALVTYRAQYEGKSGGEIAKGNSIFGEVWTGSGHAWKVLYLQETYIK